MLSRIFIDRPIFAWVIAIVIMLLGIGGILTLPVEQYPDIAPPSVNIRATYPGASAETIESSVTQVIEQQLTGIDGLIYFQSTSNSSGSVTVTVTFQKGTDPDIAQVQVQNKVQQALPRLPQQVQQQGLVVTKSNADFLMVVSIYDETDRMTSADVSDYLVSNLQDPIGRLAGVGDVNVFGSQYAMRIWLDPFKLSAVQLMPADVIAAIQAQNTQVAAGQIGGQPSPDSQMLNAIVTARSRLTTADQFRDIIVKTQTDGSKVLLRDVARVELGSESYNNVSRLNGHPGAGIAIQLAPGADALKTAKLVRSYVDGHASAFPQGLRYAYPNDSTAFIKLSVEDVIKTLIEAIILVVLVMFVFLQSWRATLIPAIAVPVVLLGTFGVLAAFGFSINTLTLFGMVLAIGLLVDDAIVVVENVERVMEEEPDISPRDATIKSMSEINIALIAIALVLSAVFLPMAFFGGSTGVIYKQFSITIVSSMVLSVVVALILSPALAATLLKRPDHAARRGGPWIVQRAHHYGDRFNAWFARMSEGYRARVARLFGHMKAALLVYGAIVVLLVLIFLKLPTSFLPVEDQGIAQLQFTLPAGATQARTIAAAKTIERYFLGTEGKNTNVVYAVIGGNQAGTGQNAGRGFLSLAPWDERKGSANSAEAITRRATAELGREMRDVQFYALNPPAVRGLGQSSGFTLELLNSGGLSREEFKARRDQLIAEASADPILAQVRQNSLEDTPTLSVQIDQAKVGALGLTQAAVDQTLSAAWGGNYVNDFVDRGRVKRVYVQGDAPYRSRPEDLANWFVRGASGQMAPFSAFAHIDWGRAPNTLTRFNGLASYEIQGQSAPGKSSGDAMARIAELAGQLPGVSIAWAGLSYQEQISGGQAPYLYGLSLLVVFLCLAALYESWSIPFAVMLVMPLGLIGATLAVLARGLENDIYFQVGLLTTMGLSAKNAILIVEFAEQAERQGRTAVEAALEAARIRLRPILMTSLAFIFGVLPLAISTGAGAKSRVAIGTAVMGGMITATVLAIFFVPLFFVLVRRLFRKGHAEKPDGPASGGAAEALA
ncbi:efflux RND transporter permease subunit [Edaphosphingomonas haloaromaticamans]|uniref:Efflux pump membrane transporter n=1 Tax=Edaphosphingomonas haloaromaticamans TaxID=653954 RepID=A0A1S1HE93_9SPHN|nr:MULTISPECIES: efflux RND transporter permease subunit [Sphingomonas]MDX3885087.1 efflux RND transporter permease subunit [Sphingomonas sp.]OHT18810.1 Multidrug efflux pump subunit AcrB [Sphingomonas haloaromaticamans]